MHTKRKDATIGGSVERGTDAEVYGNLDPQWTFQGQRSSGPPTTDSASGYMECVMCHEPLTQRQWFHSNVCNSCWCQDVNT